MLENEEVFVNIGMYLRQLFKVNYLLGLVGCKFIVCTKALQDILVFELYFYLNCI